MKRLVKRNGRIYMVLSILISLLLVILTCTPVLALENRADDRGHLASSIDIPKETVNSDKGIVTTDNTTGEAPVPVRAEPVLRPDEVTIPVAEPEKADTIKDFISTDNTTGEAPVPVRAEPVLRPDEVTIPIAEPEKNYPEKPDENLPDKGQMLLDSGWTCLLSETFEGSFPSGNGWEVYGDPTWDDDNYKPYAGYWSGWCAKGGDYGLNPEFNDYPNGMDGWMIFGPFDLSQASDAEVDFRYWNESESGYDFFEWRASDDGGMYDGWQISGDTGGWVYEEFDLDDYCGDSSVWIAFRFISDGSVTFQGAFIDEIYLWANNTISPPPSPTLISPADGATVGGTAVTFSWQASPGATKYWLEVNSSADWDSETRLYYANVGIVLSKEVTGLPNDGSTLYWRVWAGNDAGWSPPTDRSFVNGSLTKPPSPVLLYPADGATVEGTAVTFSWQASSGATKYWLEVNTSADWGSETRLYYANVGIVLSKQVTGLPNDGSTLYWRVWAGNDAGWSSPTSRSFINGSLSKPPSPVLLYPADGATVMGTAVTFSWQASSGATKYWLEVNSSADWDSETRLYYANVGIVLSKEVTGLPNDGSTLYWRVWAGNDAGWSTPTSRSFINGGNKPPTPVLSSPANGANIDGAEITFSWQVSSGATKYWLEVNTSPGWEMESRFYYANVGDVLSKEVTGFPDDGTVYYWRAWAGNSYGWSTPSSGRSLTNSHLTEVGVYWVSEYSIEPDLENSEAMATGFADILDDGCWETMFNEGDDEVTESDFKSNDGADSVDICWFTGHGDVGCILLKNATPLTDRVHYYEVEWGDGADGGDLDWVFLHACNTLEDDDAASSSYLKSNARFAQSMDGVRMICGATTAMWNYSTDGQNVARRLTGSGGEDLCTVKEAWFSGLRENNRWLEDPEDQVTARVIAEDASYENDYIRGYGTGPAPEVAVDDYYRSWDYTIPLE